MDFNRLPASSRNRHDSSTINLEVGVRSQAARGSTRTLCQKMNSIIAEITMKSEADDGRPCEFWTNYRPHLVPKGTEDYLGVSVIGVSESEAVLPGTTSRVRFELMYSGVDYGSLFIGASFEIRKGRHVVCDGIVLKIIEEAISTQ